MLPALLLLLLAEDPAAVRGEIEATYQRSTAVFLKAKSPEDLDRASRVMDTADWIAVDPAGKRRTWAEHRKYAPDVLKTLPAEIKLEIESFEIRGGEAVVLAVVWARSGGALWTGGMRVRDTWVKTKDGWRRKLHEKIGPR